MGWTIPMGSEVLVAAATNPRRGELWAYCDDRGGIVVHRYRRRIEAGHVLQGDTCVHADAPVNDEQLIGRVVSVLYHGRVLSVGWCNRILGAAQRVPRSMAGRTARTLRRVPFPVARADARRR